MAKISDQSYLLNDQYKDAHNLDARVRLHQLFSTNQSGWQRWCFDHYTLPATADVLEIGCGPAHLWTTNIDRLPPGWQITLSDFSDGMLEQARRNLGERAGAFRFELADAQQLPFAANTFDAVIANHMLYHVPDRLRALSEMRRVLKAGCHVYIATNGINHLRELAELKQRFDPALDFGWQVRAPQVFSMDTGGAEVAAFFQDVRVAHYEDALHITQAAPLVDYIFSMSSAAAMQSRRAELQRFFEKEIQQQGAIHITKESGMFIGEKA